MPRYFFDVTGFKLFTDRKGVVLVNEDAAWSAAVSSFGEMLRDIDGLMPDQRELVVTVRDRAGDRVAVLRFTGERRNPPAGGQPHS